MQTTDYTFKVLTAEAGHKLAYAVAPDDIRQSLIATKIYLGANDDASRYKEITDAEADALRARIDALDAEAPTPSE